MGTEVLSNRVNKMQDIKCFKRERGSRIDESLLVRRLQHNILTKYKLYIMKLQFQECNY